MEFLKEVHGISVFTNLSKEDGIRARAIQFLCEYNQYSRLSLNKKKVKSNVILPFSEELEQFKNYQVRKHLISQTTLKHYDKEVGRFLLYLLKQRICKLDSISIPIILDYCNTHAPCMKATMHNSFSSLRVFLRYLYKSGHIGLDLSGCIPKRESKIPPAFSREEIKEIFQCVDRSSPPGKRDFAIILIAYRLGLRTSDIIYNSISILHLKAQPFYGSLLNLVNRINEHTNSFADFFYRGKEYIVYNIRLWPLPKPFNCLLHNRNGANCKEKVLQ